VSTEQRDKAWEEWAAASCVNWDAAVEESRHFELGEPDGTHKLAFNAGWAAALEKSEEPCACISVARDLVLRFESLKSAIVYRAELEHLSDRVTDQELRVLNLEKVLNALHQLPEPAGGES